MSGAAGARKLTHARIRATQTFTGALPAGGVDRPHLRSVPVAVPASGTVLPAAFLARMAKEIKQVAYFKIETARAASKLCELIRLGGDAIEGPWDGEEAIALLPNPDAGANDAMTGGVYPDGIKQHYPCLCRRPTRGGGGTVRTLATRDQL